jgi:uncharacterized protein with HEPN domain
VPSSDPIQRFSDIIENIDRIERFTAGMDLQAFAVAEQTVCCQIRLLAISEAAAKLDTLATDLCAEIPWRDIRGLGNRLRHDYANIDLVRIWLLLERDLPPLKTACCRALQRLESGGEA